MKQQSRRAFLKGSGTLFSSSWVALNMPLIIAAGQTACSRRDEGHAWVNLTADEAAGFAAIADQVIPPDETPGAAEIGVVYFLDEALNGFLSQAALMLKAGLSELDAKAGEHHRDTDKFAALSFDDQTALLKDIENSRMFQTMINVTRMGVFALPEYGGNKNHAGWKLIGFEHRHAWQPPFGHYDEMYINGEGDHAES